MRDDVRRSGKRPREAYSEMVASVPKKFRLRQPGGTFKGDALVLGGTSTTQPTSSASMYAGS